MPNTSDTKATLTASHFTRLSRLWGEKVIRGVLAACWLREPAVNTYIQFLRFLSFLYPNSSLFRGVHPKNDFDFYLVDNTNWILTSTIEFWSVIPYFIKYVVWQRLASLQKALEKCCFSSHCIAKKISCSKFKKLSPFFIVMNIYLRK
jgi:hypothetical protein